MFQRWTTLGRWNQILLILLAVYLALWPLEPLSGSVYTLRVALQFALYGMGALSLAVLTYRVVRLLVRRFLWRVRHRMVVAYFLVGVVPLALALLLTAVAAALVILPVAAYLVQAEIAQRAAALYATADSLAWELRASDEQRRIEIGRTFLRDAPRRYPGLQARLETENGPITFPPGVLSEKPPAALESYRGVVRKDDDYYLAAYAQFEPGAPSLLLMVPLHSEFMSTLLPSLGRVELEPQIRARRTALAFAESGRAVEPADPPVQAHLPPPAHPLDWALVWPASTSVLDWASGETRVEKVFALQTRPSAVLRMILAQQSPDMTALGYNVGRVLIVLFAVALLISTVVAVWLTRTATGAIHDLYEGTRHVDQGDFSYRVPQRGYSQLTELARSFNTMIASIERLIQDSKERQRLESELAIAQEVQAQLFPRHAPRLSSLEVFGMCRPARAVSGDFYDYVKLSDHRMTVSLGDVSGKGISAALVMAAMHSSVRTQLALLAGDADVTNLAEASARLVTETNRQLCVGTASDKFATLFFGAYDSRTQALAYVNAGHLPPVLIRRGKAHRLDVTGMIVGAFPFADYEASAVALEPGDLLVAFTDGLTEPENPYGEQFGEERLIETLAGVAEAPLDAIVRTVIAEVDHWTGLAPEQQDDMTILVARRLEV